MCVDSSPLRRVTVFQRQWLELLVLVQSLLFPYVCVSVWPIVHEGWSWWCPWRWPLHSSRAGHQGQLHPVLLLSSGVKWAWRNLLLEPQPPEASPSDTAGLRQENERLLIHFITQTLIGLSTFYHLSSLHCYGSDWSTLQICMYISLEIFFIINHAHVKKKHELQCNF